MRWKKEKINLKRKFKCKNELHSVGFTRGRCAGFITSIDGFCYFCTTKGISVFFILGIAKGIGINVDMGLCTGIGRLIVIK